MTTDAMPRPPSPLTLRAEPFGGILFDAADGTHVELDHAAYLVARDWLRGTRSVFSEEERALLADLRSQVANFRDQSVVVQEPAPRTPPSLGLAHATVLSAPTLIDFQVTHRCNVGCPHCYASSSPRGDHVSLADARRVLAQASRLGVCQVALGGGEPLLHPDILAIIRHARSLGMVPNLTTTGLTLDRETLDVLHQCCGAVALSLEALDTAFTRRRRSGFAAFEVALQTLLNRGIPTVLQVTLSAQTLPDLPRLVDYALRFPLYGVIFLAYKPVGRGHGFDHPLSVLDAQTVRAALRDALERLMPHTKVGYDCCLAPSVAGVDQARGAPVAHLVEGCSAARSSVGVTPELDVVACTFLPGLPLGNLHHQDLAQVWDAQPAQLFRRRLDAQVEDRAGCRACTYRRGCLGGCPAWDLVPCTVTAQAKEAE
jgi:radical SAM protein with 4Fe4S-binding SPASM domain